MIQQKYCSKGHLFDGSYKDTNPFYQEINNTTQNEFFGAKGAVKVKSLAIIAQSYPGALGWF